ncbi:MAG: MinD/ParA family protein [Roseburia sp.]|uniref:MinD/ParA family protein n=1 Tax=Roseburia sp. 831b TaxID=1261635 RepID=UPI000951F9BC|nr:MinD/ParA family protein [Roseburia sp. 831b]MDD6216528.1 MinD/ParA family protein [Roseburia sp.]WVK73861.1 MinD/ParA family protein [Roseburia sp. 831b]
MDQAESLRNVIKKQNQTISQMARVITVTSGKGGVGKSNIAVNLAVQFQKQGKKVIIFDADFGLANVEVMFGTVPKYNIADMIYREMEMTEIITEGPNGIGFVSGGSGIDGLGNLSQEQIVYLVKCLNELNKLADIIIIDTGAGISDSVLEFVMASPEVLLVTTPDPSSLTDAYSLIKMLYHNPNFVKDMTKISVVANKTVSVEEGHMVYQKLNSVVNRFLDGNVEYLGMIPQDIELEKSVRQQKTVSLNAPASNAARAFEVLASNILNGEQKDVKLNWGITQLFSRIITRSS